MHHGSHIAKRESPSAAEAQKGGGDDGDGLGGGLGGQRTVPPQTEQLLHLQNCRINNKARELLLQGRRVAVVHAAPCNAGRVPGRLYTSCCIALWHCPAGLQLCSLLWLAWAKPSSERGCQRT